MLCWDDGRGWELVGPLLLQERKLCCLDKIKCLALSALARGVKGEKGSCRDPQRVAARLLVCRGISVGCSCFRSADLELTPVGSLYLGIFLGCARASQPGMLCQRTATTADPPQILGCTQLWTLAELTSTL